MSYEYNYVQPSSDGIIDAFGMTFVIMWIIYIAVAIFQIVCVWKVYKKAGKGGWEYIVPIYGDIVLLEMVDLPTWYIILYFIPIANIYINIKTHIELAHKFNKSTGFGIGLAFIPVVFFALLAFENGNTYTGNSVNDLNPSSEKLESNNNVKYCASCGTKVESSTLFCPNCGNKIS